jgi:endonuclease/exonuclease/phosphatase (EEP) superfamily protein YafD
MSPELLAVMQMFQQQRADVMQQRAQEIKHRKDNLAAQEARFQQQQAEDLQGEKDAQRLQVKALAELQAESQDAIKMLGDFISVTDLCEHLHNSCGCCLLLTRPTNW